MSRSSYGNPGGEANRKYEQLSEELQRLHEARSPLQKFLALLFSADAKEERQMENWRKGAIGELEIGHLLDRIASENDFVVLHDRAIPRSQANIDHILITPAGIFDIDAKNHTGLVRIEEGSLLDLNAVPTLYVGNRKQSSLVLGVKKQISHIEAALTKAKMSAPVFGMLAFYKAEFPIFFKPVEIDGVLINGKGIGVTQTNHTLRPKI
jgi:hypothetical protein